MATPPYTTRTRDAPDGDGAVVPGVEDALDVLGRGRAAADPREKVAVCVYVYV